MNLIEITENRVNEMKAEGLMPDVNGLLDVATGNEIPVKDMDSFDAACIGYYAAKCVRLELEQQNRYRLFAPEMENVRKNLDTSCGAVTYGSGFAKGVLAGIFPNGEYMDTDFKTPLEILYISKKIIREFRKTE